MEDPSDNGGQGGAKFLVSLGSGAFAGMTAEAVLFPLDCLKTRVQSPHGFLAAGGFRGMYRGLGTAIASSAPCSAIFFVTYEAGQHVGKRLASSRPDTGHARADEAEVTVGAPDANASNRPSSSSFWPCGALVPASMLGEVAACGVRAPADLMRQRLQIGHAGDFAGAMEGARRTPRFILMASFRATVLRDVAHSGLQYPMYEYFKLRMLAHQQQRRTGKEQHSDAIGRLPTWQAGCCGSAAGAISAVMTAPLDLLRTRVNLRVSLSSGGSSSSASSGSLAGDKSGSGSSKRVLWEEVRSIYSEGGVAGFFAGAGLRAAWMGFGGFVFLGSFEWARAELGKYLGVTRLDGPLAHDAREEVLAVSSASASSSPSLSSSARSIAKVPAAGESPLPSSDTASARDQPGVIVTDSAAAAGGSASSSSSECRMLEHEPPPLVSFVAGLIAGVAVDVPLHPIDTVKTRLQARQGFKAAGGISSLWSGLSAVLITSVPGSAIFFVTYEQVRKALEDFNMSSSLVPAHMHAAFRDAASAVPAEVAACSVRVPCEVMKQRMQTQRLQSNSSSSSSLAGVIRQISAEGVSGFFAGFGATVSREVPFALIQMPLFEELKHQHPWSKQAKDEANTMQQGFIGMSCGACAGAVAGLCTTPLDVTKTRIMLTARRSERRGMLETVAMIYGESGMSGLFRGVTPRTLHCCIGGALWLGAFEWVKILLI